MLGIPINLFLLITANLIQGKRKLISNWFVALVIIDVIVVILAVYYQLDTAYSADAVPTFCRFVGDAISFFCISYIGLTTYANSKFYKPRGLVFSAPFLLLLFVLFYAAIHLISPFIPNIVQGFRSNNSASQQQAVDLVRSLFALLAVPLKVILFIIAFGITTLENQALIRLRGTLRKSVDKRKVFFSSDSILKTIYKIFDAQKVNLFIVLPIENEQNSIERKAHLYEYYPDKEESLSDFKVVEIKGKDTVIGRLLEEENELSKFDGIKPIKYHGGLIGCLQIEKRSRKNLLTRRKEFWIL